MTNAAREHLIQKLKQLTHQISPNPIINIPANLFPHASRPHQPTHEPQQPRRTYTARDILDALNNLVNERGEHVTFAEFTRHTGISNKPVVKHFGTFTELRRRAGLQPNPRSHNQYTDEQLLEYFHQVVQKLGRIPTELEFERHAPVSIGTLKRRFGNKQNIIHRYLDYKRNHQHKL